MNQKILNIFNQLAALDKEDRDIAASWLRGNAKSEWLNANTKRTFELLIEFLEAVDKEDPTIDLWNMLLSKCGKYDINEPEIS